MTNGNDEAYPRAGFFHDADTYDVGSSGLTKREYFAAMAMQGLLAANGDNDEGYNFFMLADEAVKNANALILALNDSERKMNDSEWLDRQQQLADAEGR